MESSLAGNIFQDSFVTISRSILDEDGIFGRVSMNGTLLIALINCSGGIAFSIVVLMGDT